MDLSPVSGGGIESFEAAGAIGGAEEAGWLGVELDGLETEVSKGGIDGPADGGFEAAEAGVWLELEVEALGIGGPSEGAPVEEDDG